MQSRSLSRLALALVVLAAACSDADAPLEVPGPAASVGSQGQGQLVAWFNQASPDVLDIPQTVFMDNNEETGQLVVGIENPGIARAVENALERHGIPASAYRIIVTPPILQAATLRDVHRPTLGGVQIHFGGYLCTLGFNVSHAGGRSFITNSHCTNKQGGTEGTEYYQPVSSVNGNVIAVEVDDPEYTVQPCSRGKVCRYSDASRALYSSGTTSTQGVIAKTDGMNTGSLTVASNNFTITEQDNTSTSYSGTFHKVGRTTGWTSGTASYTCVSVNVSGSNIQQRCQTMVVNAGATIVGPGDSGSPVFRRLQGDNVQLVGILWGGSSDGHTFVFSPLKNIQDELGAVDATASGGSTPTNNPPTASFTYNCNDLNCSFDGRGSDDPDGSIVSYSWNFAGQASASGSTASHTFGAAGTYAVTLTVTDDDNASDSDTQQVTVTAGGGTTYPISLTVSGSKDKGTKSADLSWGGATTGNVTIYRDGDVIADSTPNDGSYHDVIGKGGGTHIYKVCEAGTDVCSAEVPVSF